MAINASSIGRPGTLVTIGTSGIIPQPITSFNSAYIYVTVPGGVYSPLVAGVPQLVTNLDDYLNLIGGSIPSSTTDWAAFTSYNAIKLYFRNVSNAPIYVIRVAPTPSVQIIVPNAANAGGIGTTRFVISVNGVYFGSEALIDLNTGLQANDSAGRPIFYIPTTGIDAPDNGYDIVQALEADARFTAGYYVTRTDVEAQSGVFNIFSRNAKTLINVEEFGYVDAMNDVQSFLATTIPADINGDVWARGELVPAASIEAVRQFAQVDEISLKLQSKGAQLLEIVTQGDGATVYGAVQVGIPTPVPGEFVPRFFEQVVFAPGDRLVLLGPARNELVGSATNGVSLPDGQPVQTEYIVKTITPSAVTPAGYDLAWDIELADSSDAYFAFTEADGTALTAEAAVTGWQYDAYSELHRFQSVQIHYLNANQENVISITNGNTAAAIVAESAPGAGDGLLLSIQALVGPDFIVEDNNQAVTPWTAQLKITSKSGVPVYLFPGTDRQGILDENVSSAQLGQVYFFQASSRYIQAADYIHAIENSIDPEIHGQGFILAPEAFARFVQDEFAQLNAFPLTRAAAQTARLSIFGAMELIAARLNFLAVVDCGGDLTDHTQAQIELQLYKDRVASPQGHSAYYAPYLTDLESIRVPPSAAVVGIALARYQNEGFRNSPAGVKYPVRGVTDVDFTISAAMQEVSNPIGLNSIRILATRGVVVWGARTMSADPLFAFVNVRVTLNRLAGTLSRAYDNNIFDVIDGQGQLFAKLRGTTNQVLQQLWREGTLFGAQPENAYATVIDETNNPGSQLEQGIVNLAVYVVPSPTLERLIVSVTRSSIGNLEFDVRSA